MGEALGPGAVGGEAMSLMPDTEMCGPFWGEVPMLSGM